MNTFVLAIVALGLVGFLILSRRRRAAASSSPAEGSPSSRPSRRRRRGAEPAPLAPVTAMAETAASRPPPPLFDTPPLERIAPPIPDWTPHDDMIVEPGWPLPGEISGSWTTGGGAAVASPVAVEEPPTSPEEPEPEPDPVALADEWTMPATPYGETVADTEPALPADPGFPAGPEPADADMEAWVPGVSEVDPIAVAEREPGLLPEPESPAGHWADAEAEITAAEAPALWMAEPGARDDLEPEHEPAGPPLWTPPGDSPAPDEPAEPPAAAFDEPPVAFADPVATFEEPAVDFDDPPVMPVEPAWEPASSPVDPVPAADLHEQSRELADLLPRAVSGLRPLLSVSDALGVTPRMLAVLHTLAERPLSLPEQARIMGVSRPVVADLCARLEQLGFARRERDESDRRRTRVALTDRGRRLAGETAGTPNPASLAAVLEQLSRSERETLVSGLRAIASGVRRPS